MSVDFAGAAVGTAFGELYSLVKEVAKTVAAFHPQLKKIESTLSEMDPIIKKIYYLYEQLDRLKEMDPIKELLDEGKGLVNKCLMIHPVNLYKKYTHSNKLTEYNAAVREKFQIYVPLLAARNDAEMLMKMEEIMGKLSSIYSSQANGGALQTMLEALNNLSVPAAPNFIVGSEVEASLSKLRERLLKEGASVIVLTGPGGCGKTTLLKKLCHDVAIEGKFKDNIMFVPVSKKPNLTDVVQKMYRHNGFKVPEIKSEEDAVHCLQQLLNKIGQNPVLLVLDDVWKESESIVDKFVCDDIKDYKIVVTSRYEFPRFRPVHHLNPLTHDEAVELFLQCATVDDRSMGTPDTKLLSEIVEHCKRLPLVIKVVAKSLRGQHYAFWRKKLNELNDGGSLLDSEVEINTCLRKSLDDMNGDPSIKERFMDLGSFPEDCKIPVTALIDMWVELYRLDPNGLRAFTDLHELVSRNLADLVVTRRDSSDDHESYSSHYYNGHYAQQHDLLRELVIMECDKGEIEKRDRLILELNGNEFPNWWSEQKQQPLSARLVSISTDGICEIKPLEKINITNCHNFSTLPAQIGQLTSLEVVRLNSCTSLSLLPDSIRSLQNVKLLDISECQKLSALPYQIGQMVNLDRINMRGCLKLSELPRSIVKLRKLRKVICEKEKAVMWGPLKDTLPSLAISLFEEEPNLAWLE
ncbi:probable disease resistance protein At5g66900 isoform X2 [Eucalyptus grandis]|uniref:probable disease resistance protein At5g66900 isoform X2 n=1 Tax=Eucalyptus grandis TaxID=71139 RepID=UPI00192EFB9A|nr:probable disease resistance protein At5g66900 isoform X2 [Eucalyptus grandis]